MHDKYMGQSFASNSLQRRVIASEPQASAAIPFLKRRGLLRRKAPRNDTFPPLQAAARIGDTPPGDLTKP
jgi:hypothetical protein